MDFKKFEYFLHVAEQGSFSRAASVVGVAQPALGRQVAQLETACGVRLFYRHGRGVTLTAAGEELVTRIRPLLRQMGSVMADLATIDGSATGQVTLGMTPTMVGLVALPLLNTLTECYPNVRLNIVSGYSGYVHEWLTDGRVDIAVLHDVRRSRHIAVDFLASAELFLVSALASGTQPRPAVEDISLADMARLPLVLPTRTHGLRRTLESAATRQKLALNVTYELDTLTLMREIALSGRAHTVLAMPAVRQELIAGKIMVRRIVEPRIETRLMLATALNHPTTEVARCVMVALKQVLREQVRDASIPLYMTVVPS